MSHALHVIPDYTGSAAENMAHDFLFLQRYQPSDAIRIRHYEWSRPSYTFGMSQKISYVKSEIPDQSYDLIRRPTGGGVVNHIDDWTYSLAIPATHPLCKGQPIDTYRLIHEAMIEAMGQQGVDAALNLTAQEDITPAICFNKPELYDVVLRNLPTKVSGAAQKRTKSGFLMQGSIWKPTVGNLEWNRFYNDFIFQIAKIAEAEISYETWPDWIISEEEQLIEQFDSEEWNFRR